MYVSWTKHLTTDEEKNDFNRRVWRAKPVLDRVINLVEAELKSIDDTERDPKAYDNAGWAYKQAFKNGMKAGLSNIKQLIDLSNQKKPNRE